MEQLDVVLVLVAVLVSRVRNWGLGAEYIDFDRMITGDGRVRIQHM